MLGAAHEVLIDLGILRPGDPLPPFSARMSGNLGLLFYFEGGASYLIKIGLLTTLDREYRGLTAAYAAMPRSVPEPLRLGTYQSHQVLVTRGVKHKLVLPMQGPADIALFEEGIEAYLITSARAFKQSGRPAWREKLQDALIQTSSLVDWPRWEAYWERIQHDAKNLPPVLQHGDFSANNIGVSESTLVFFDWEEFGLVDLPGFDLAILLLSLSNFSMTQLLERLSRPSVEASVAQRGCRALGISTDDLVDLFPAYASLYIQTKSRLGYPSTVTNRIAAALAEWIRIAPVGAPDHLPFARPQSTPAS